MSNDHTLSDACKDAEAIVAVTKAGEPVTVNGQLDWKGLPGLTCHGIGLSACF